MASMPAAETRRGAIAVGGEVLPPGDEMALGVEAGAEGVRASGAVGVVGDVVFAGPEELDGAVDLLGEPRGFHQVVVLQAAAKAAADAAEMNGDVAGLDVRGAGCLGAAFAGRLAGGPELQLAVLKGGGCVHRLHGHMGDEGIGVGGFDDLGRGGQCGVHIAVAAQRVGGRGLEQFGGAGGKLLAALGRAGAEVPIDLEGAAGGLGLPPGVGDDGDAGLDSFGDNGDAGFGGGVTVAPVVEGGARMMTWRTPGSFLIWSRLAVLTLPP